MSKFKTIWEDGDIGEVVCPCGRSFDYQSGTEDGLVRRTDRDGHIYLVLECPECGETDE